MKKLSTEEMIALVERSYFYNVDNKHLEPTISCFTEDAELIVQTASVSHNGQDEIRRMLRDFMRDNAVIYHGEFSHVVDVDNQLIASQFLARIERSDGSEVSMRNCNFFLLQDGHFSKVMIYMSGENPLV